MGCYDNKMVKITRRSIKEMLVCSCNLSGVTAANIVDTIIEELINAIIKEHTLKIAGFGSFIVHTRAPRKGRNIKTGQIIFIKEYKGLSFKASASLKTRLQKQQKRLQA